MTSSAGGTTLEEQLGELLVARGLLTTAELDDCRREQRTSSTDGGAPRPLSQILLQRRLLDGTQLSQALEATAAHPALNRGPAALEAPLGTVGGYHLRGEVARGGMGVVYEAHDPRLDRRVAIKVLPEGDDRAQAIRRLRQEAAAAARLSHPGIIAVHQVSDEGWLVMDFVDGPTLTAALPELSLKERIRLLAEVAEAVGHAHAAGVIHRDLKPDNILLTPDRRAVVTDFGLARHVADATRLTRTGTVMGTVDYMAPEQVAGERDRLDARTDVWALGVLLYELLCGRRPFAQPTEAATYEAILRREPPAPNRVRRGAPAALAAVCGRALEKDPERRYPDAAALAAELRRWQAGEGVTARRPSRVDRVRRGLWTRRRAALVFGLAAAGVALALGLMRARERDRQALVRQREAARAAARAGRWQDALVVAEAVLASGADRELAALADRARRALAAEAAGELERLMTVAAESEYGRTLDGFARRIEDVRGFFYIPSAPIRDKLDAIARSLEELAELSQQPAYASRARTWRLLGIGWSVLGRTGPAEGALSKAIELDADDGRAHAELGRLYLLRSHQILFTSLQNQAWERAATWAQRAAKHLGRALGRWDGATPLAAHVASGYLMLARRQPGLEAHCAEGLAQFGDVPGTEEYHYLRGWVITGRPRIEAWGAALQRCPHSAWLWMARGCEYQRLGQSRPALSDYDAALQIDPNEPVSLSNRGGLLHDLGQLSSARVDLDRAVAAAPWMAMAWCNRGRTRCAQGDAAGGLADYAKALEAEPDHVITLYNRGNARERGRDRAGAIADYDRVVAVDPGNVWGQTANTLLNRANLRYAQKQHDRARADYDAALRLDPRLGVAFVNRARLSLEQRDINAAAADYENAIRVAPRNSGGWSGRAKVRMLRGKLQPAVEDFTQAIALDPTNVDAWFGRGQALRYLGRAKDGLADLEKTIALDGTWWDAWWQYGQSLQAAGRTADALTAYRKAHELTVARFKPVILWRIKQLEASSKK